MNEEAGVLAARNFCCPILLLAGALVAQADLLYTQPWEGEYGHGISSFCSDLPGWTFDNQVADDFVVPDAGAWQIDSITVWGAFYGTVPPDGSPLNGFNVRFPVEAGNGPSNTDIEERLHVTGFTQTDTGYVLAFRPLLQYDIILDPPVVLNSGTHWLSVQAIRNERWYWATHASVPPLEGSRIYVRDPSGNDSEWGELWQPFSRPYDVAFSLSGSAVPEPTALGILCVGLALTWTATRRARGDADH